MSKLKKCAFLKLVIGIVVLISGTDVFAQNAISTGVPFLLIGPNSRFSAMGETGTAIADDATAMHWNPSGLAFQEQGTEVNFTHSPWLAGLGISDLFYDYLAAKKPIKSINGTVGVDFTYLNIGEVIYRDEFGNADPSKDYKAYEFAVAIAYATKVTDNLGLGLTTRFIYSRLSPNSLTVGNEKGTGTAFTTSFDISALYKPKIAFKDSTYKPTKFWGKFLKVIGHFVPDNYGINLSNLGPKISYVDAAQADPIPTQLRIGFAYQVFKNQGNELTLTGDFSKLLVNRFGVGESDPFYKAMFTSWKGGPSGIGRTVQSSIGAEYWYGSPKLIALRAGYFYEDPSNGNRKYITLGAGLRYSLYGFDFSYINTI
jgi:hypothetical protein